MAAKKPAKKPAKSARKPNAAFAKEFTPSPQLAEVIGSKPVARTAVIKKLWDYFKKNKLNEGQVINLDDKLKAVYGTKKNRTMGKNKVAVRGDQIFMTEVSQAFSHLKG
jgi:chromatin remodeling complex protein RSC6